MNKSRTTKSSPGTGAQYINQYEHHLDLKKNTLIPFKAEISRKVINATCNWHDNIELLLFTEGKGTLRYGTENIEVKRDILAIINSQTMHSLSSEEGMTFCFIIIDNSFFEENGIDISSLSFERLTSDTETFGKCLSLHDAYQSYKAEKKFLCAAKARQAALELVIDLCTKYSSPKQTTGEKNNSSEKYIKQAMLYINDNYAEKITLDGIARVIGINKSYFAREFKKYSGQTVHTYINSLRCQMADRFLSQGMKVTEAAMASGFESLSYFSRTYKKIRGISPVYTK